MRTPHAAWILTLAGLLSVTTTASAQFWPGRGYYDDAGVWGAYTSAINNATSRYVAQSDRLAGERFANQQMLAQQRGIQNTLSSQATARTQEVLSQQQSNRDLWFQVQQQQMAQRRAMGGAGSAAPSIPVGLESVAPSVAPQVADDIIPWPPVLCDPRFAQERAEIEAPYRGKQGLSAHPTKAQYETMIATASDMKVTLGHLTNEISAREYLDTEKFLDQLSDEARQRIKELAPAK
ncbi:MAG: hypothetical protein LLF97_10520 [Planctomycetaceae bacterium]|nr:hypothetical protein [Planctomycetaceae bacterium]